MPGSWESVRRAAQIVFYSFFFAPRISLGESSSSGGYLTLPLIREKGLTDSL